MMKNINWRRTIKMTLVSIIFAILLLDLSLAWDFVDSFIAPGCPQPSKLADYPNPFEDQVLTVDGLELEIWIYPSENGASIIALSGLGGSLGSMLPPVDFLLDAGYGVVQIESRACAEPVGKLTLGYLEGEDLGAVFQNPHLKGQQIGVIGFSMGGVAAIRAASLYPQIKAIVPEGGYFNLGRDLVEDSEALWEKAYLYTVAGIFWLRTGVNPWQISPIDDLPEISPRPVFLIYGEHEAETGRAELQYQAAGDPKELWIVPGGDHGSNYLVAPEEYQQRVLVFFDRYLIQP